MEKSLRVGIVGASGYVGGEIFRILVNHPGVNVIAATSKQHEGEVIHRVHPNLRSFTDLKFSAPNVDALSEQCDFVFTAVPHGSAVKIVPDLVKSGLKIVDMSADFRLQDTKAYEHWYNYKHPHPEMLKTTPFGVPELYQDEIRNSKLVANPGCMAITSILALAPFVKAGLIDLEHIVVDSKIGSSGGGTKPSMGTHHAERYGVMPRTSRWITDTLRRSSKKSPNKRVRR